MAAAIPYLMIAGAAITAAGAIQSGRAQSQMADYNAQIAERDAMVSRQNAMQQLVIEDLPGQHHLHMDTPAPVAELVNAFLDE